MHLLGFRFAPRIRDLADKRLYIHGDAKRYPTLARLISGSVNVKRIRAHWDAILRLAASIQQGTVTASLMLRKLGSYPRQNGLALALRELGRIERTLFTLDWLQDIDDHFGHNRYTTVKPTKSSPASRGVTGVLSRVSGDLESLGGKLFLEICDSEAARCVGGFAWGGIGSPRFVVMAKH